MQMGAGLKNKANILYIIIRNVIYLEIIANDKGSNKYFIQHGNWNNNPIT